jgi:hypothetical protein
MDRQFCRSAFLTDRQIGGGLPSWRTSPGSSRWRTTFPRFCGRAFTEAADHELGLLCVRAHNDWMVDEWCGPAARGRMIPLAIVPLRDAESAAAEVRRNAVRGVRAVCVQALSAALTEEYPVHTGPRFVFSGPAVSPRPAQRPRPRSGSAAPPRAR